MMTLKITRQRGLSMVELLVALAISSFLILGITQAYLDNKRNYVFQQSQASNQENTRFAEITLNTWLNKAGYRRSPDHLIEYAFPAVGKSGECGAFAEGAVVASFSGAAGEVGLCIRYEPASSTELDCQGNAVHTATNTKMDIPFGETKPEELVVLAIKFVPDAELNKGTLQCKNLSGTTPAFAELLDGIADMQFEFATGQGDLLVKELQDKPWSTSVTGFVRAVRYSMLLASRTNQRESDSLIYKTWLDAAPESTNKARITSGDNKRVYQLASSTQTLRNMMP